MATFSIDGSGTAAEITDFIRNIEVSRARFIGAEIRSGMNILHFNIERSPRPPTLVLMGAPAPADSDLVWIGAMQIQSKLEQVQLYRSKVTGIGGNLNSRIMAVQSAVQVDRDGKAGPETWAAIERALLETDTLGADPDYTNARSEKIIATLLPHVQPYARALYFKAKANDININIISGTRTYEEQDALYAMGRDQPGEIVTNAKGGHSNHNFGIAFDIGVFEGRNYLEESPKYVAVGVLGQELGLEWGGSWATFVDRPHFQLKPDWAIAMTDKKMLAELRRRKSAGADLA